jgi:TRAP-type C4-dicarboxylate transport system permease small subunit
MQNISSVLARWLSLAARAALVLASIGLVLMTVFIGWQVFGRFVLNDSPSWTEPLAILLMGWFIFLGAAIGVREGYHLSFEVLLYVLPPGGRRILDSVSDAAVAFFGAAMAVYGYQMAAKTWSSTIPGLGYPGGVHFIALIAGGVLISLFSLERLALRMAGTNPRRETDALLVEG